MRDHLDTLVDQEEGGRGSRVERGVLDHDEGSGGGLLGSSFPDYGIDDEDQVWENVRMEQRSLNWVQNVDKWTKSEIWMICRQTNTGAPTLFQAESFLLHLHLFSPYHLQHALLGEFFLCHQMSIM